MRIPSFLQRSGILKRKLAVSYGTFGMELLGTSPLPVGTMKNAWREKWGFVALPNPVPTGQKHLGEKSVGPVSSGCRSVPPERL